VAVRAAVAAAVLAAPAAAHANGAFPDSQSVLTPADRPREIVLVTNFGLFLSGDDGASWLWSCEQAENAFGTLYQRTATPRRRLLAIANLSLAYSDDGTCGWQIAGGALAGQTVIDVFPDPSAADHVLAVTFSVQGGYRVLESTDGGATFGRTLFAAGPGESIDGVEIAPSDPATIYVAVTTEDMTPGLARSTDGGDVWTTSRLGADLGPGIVRIVAVDPTDPARVFLRWIAAGGQAIALTTDGGASATRVLEMDGFPTSFVRLPSGTLLVGAMVQSVATLYRSRDGGVSFDAVPGAPAVRGLSERGGTVFAATDNFRDGYALGASADEGTTWEPLFRYDQATAILPCLKSQCRAACEFEVGRSVWAAEVCTADAPPLPTGSGGAGGAGAGGAGAGGGTGGTGGSSGAAGHGGAGAQPPRGGGGCEAAGGGAPGPGGAALFVLLVVAARRRRAAPPADPGLRPSAIPARSRTA
jgi:MYXO-CTERM domain-containing protein